MNRIYFDNAATTALDKEVLEAMLPYLTTHFGNPSSIYSYGRETRMAIENARKSVARILNANPGEIFFTSGGTESNNAAITAAIRDLGCRHIISSPLEHHSVLHTVEYYSSSPGIITSNVRHLNNGHVDMKDLESRLASAETRQERCFVSLMHANNEIGNILDIEAVGSLCKKYNAIFHSDCVQTVGHYPMDLRNTPVHFISASGHKFHGPKGCGILYINENVKIKPFIFGGVQERNMRAGTENVYGIVGFAKALELATENYEKDRAYIQSLKTYLIEQLRHHIKGVAFNGDAEGKSLYTVLSVSLTKSVSAQPRSEMLLFNLDINNICTSGGSACTSGSNESSHVIYAINSAVGGVNNNSNHVTVRLSLSKYNTREEVDIVVAKLKEFI